MVQLVKAAAVDPNQSVDKEDADFNKVVVKPLSLTVHNEASEPSWRQCPLHQICEWMVVDGLAHDLMLS